MLHKLKSILKKVPGIIKTYIFLNKVINELIWLVGPSERVIKIENSKMYINVRDKALCVYNSWTLSHA